MERKNIINDGPQETVSAEAAVLNSRLHYYSRLMGSSDRQLVGRVCCNNHECITTIASGQKICQVQTT